MILFLRKTHRFWLLGWIVLLFYIGFPFYYYYSRKPSRYGKLNMLRRWHSHLACGFSGIFCRIHHKHLLSEQDTYVFCANHSSSLDIMAMCKVGTGHFHFMGKSELKDISILRLFFETLDIPVNRENKLSAFRAFKKAADNLKQQMSLIIFPEGRIEAHYPPQLIDFKNGPFRLAIENAIPLVPVSIVNLWKIMWDDGAKYGTQPGFYDIYIHQPIHTQNLAVEELELLKEKVFKLINEKLIQ